MTSSGYSLISFQSVFTWNTDAWDGPGTTSLYQSHPWVLVVLSNGEALKVLADTTLCCEIDLRRESIIQFIAPSSYHVITFGPFASATDVLKSLSHTIGLLRSTYEGMKLANEKKHPFALKGAGFIGSQRYAATWMRDNIANWEHGISGQPPSRPDIGGFTRNATPKLFGRRMANETLEVIGRQCSQIKQQRHEDHQDHTVIGKDIKEGAQAESNAISLLPLKRLVITNKPVEKANETGVIISVVTINK
ncbi:unnamed protein product [Dovyalis caffra]|uniref:Glycoside hydrolase family 31 TIM barrel domain-containing protein n=1 Tax=Dovyalis caffra TaxID=77055 RepID=A0AAV1R3I9_9ROSI|nr:unnamed protein product [Dovyalis caffra]